jgi:hypothetical protein
MGLILLWWMDLNAILKGFFTALSDGWKEGDSPGTAAAIWGIPASFLFSHEKIEITEIDDASEG